MEVLLVGSVPITDHYLATDEYYILYCLRCLSDVVGFIFFLEWELTTGFRQNV